MVPQQECPDLLTLSKTFTTDHQVQIPQGKIKYYREENQAKMCEPLYADYAPLRHKISSFSELLHPLHALQYPKKLSTAYISFNNCKEKRITIVLRKRYSKSLFLGGRSAEGQNNFLLFFAFQIYLMVAVQNQMAFHSKI